MNVLLANISAHTEEMNIILLVGIAIFGGTVGARIFHRLNIPRIVGYVAIGIILGPWLGIISQQTISDLEPFNMFALGIIGFLIGGELKREIFTKFGKQVIVILLFEGLAAFLLVGTLSFAITWYFSDWKTGLAVGVVFGAICAATDPASTMNVLWEYKSRGPLTSMLRAIVALDDALALTLYAIRNTFATQGVNYWLIAMDIMQPIITKFGPGTALSDAFNKGKRLGIEYIPIVNGGQGNELVGILNANAAHRKLSAEVLAKQHEADSMYSLESADTETL